MKIVTETRTTIIHTCIDCPHHEVLPDPDPDDWFCDNDVKVKCNLSNKLITVACRPYNIIKESEIPDWCELVED